MRSSFLAVLLVLAFIPMLWLAAWSREASLVQAPAAPKAEASGRHVRFGGFRTALPFFRQNSASRPAVSERSSEYLGSEACAPCHRAIYNSYKKTAMGRSMSLPNAVSLARIPASASVFDARLNRHFEVQLRGVNLFQTEYEQSAEGQEVFRQTEKIEWLIGAGENGVGGIVRRGEYLFEAPLSFYSNAGQWKLSPGYEYGDYGFSRPVLAGCVICHSGRPRLLAGSDARFAEPPFSELAVGCENCHGPGAAHVLQKQASLGPERDSRSIVNPAELSPWLADNVCMMCHQTGQARVLRPGKEYGDFRPGQALDDTVSIFQIPFGKAAPPKDDLLEHYLSMRLSKCYRMSRGKLSCITCHDPHVQPGKEEAPAYFRQKCLVCHAASSCRAAPAVRQATHPQDNCISCHMPKRDLTVISHSALTNHRIVVTADEPFPIEAFQMTSSALPDLVHLSAVPDARNEVPPLVLLQAYRQAMLVDPAYRERYWEIGQKLASKYPGDLGVLQALADHSLQRKEREGVEAAIRYLEEAVAKPGAQMADFLLLAQLYASLGRFADSATMLRLGIARFPYEPDLYRFLAKLYVSTSQTSEACSILSKATDEFPQYDDFRILSKTCKQPVHRSQ